MKKLLFISLIVSSLFSIAQDKKKNIDPKYVFCYKNTSFTTNDYKIYIEDAINEDGLSKFKIRIFNKTNDYLIFKPSDIIFKIGNQEIACKEKQILVLPNEESWKVISVRGKGFQEEKYTVQLKQIHKVSAGAPPLKAEDISFPTNATEFTVGNFKYTIKKADLKTDKSIIRCECVYQGEGVGILSPGKCVAIMPQGQENPNADKFKGCLLETGKGENFLIEFREIKGGGDMQKSPLKLIWGETFKESKVESIPGGTINLELDGPKTADRNQ